MGTYALGGMRLTGAGLAVLCGLWLAQPALAVAPADGRGAEDPLADAPWLHDDAYDRTGYGPGDYDEQLDGAPPSIPGPGFFTGRRTGPYPRFGVDAQYLLARFEGSFEHELDGSGNEVDQDNDVPLDFGGALELRGWLRLADFISIQGAYLCGYFGGKGEARTSFIHDGVAFDEGTALTSRIALRAAWLGVTLFAVDEEHIQLGVPVGALWMEETFELKADGTKAKGRNHTVSPYVGLYADIHFGYGIGIEGEVRFFAWGDEYEDELFGYFDARAELYVTIVDHVRLSAGGRLLSAEHLERAGRNDRYFDLDMAAVTLGVSIFY